ncbi:hypothetical protein N2152v2_006473 [Parachlorella kessleri]
MQKPVAPTAVVLEPAADAAAGAGAEAGGPESHGKLRDHKPSESVGLVSNVSLESEEVEKFFAPESALEEEERLRREREQEVEQQQQVADPPPAELAAPVLEDRKFLQLEQLLNQSRAYTQFLAEQLADVEKQEEEAAEAGGEAEEEEQPAGKTKGRGKGNKAGSKRKAATTAAAAPAAKRPAREDVQKEIEGLFTGSLRDYQLKGVRWLLSLHMNGLNGILADQMGLGKTVQTIAFLCTLRKRGTRGPFLVVGPLSTLPNWVAEFERWAPDFPVVLYHGSKQERQELRRKRMPAGKVTDQFPVVVTSYEIVIADVKFLQKYDWKYVVVDEGHRLKNFNCKLIRELRTIPTQGKLLLTGTPLQNNLTELWSLLNFLLPDVFSSLENFESWFDFSDKVGQEGADKAILAQEQRNKVVSKLHQILKPFLLRRVKTDVETSLPGKMEVILYAPMSDKQREINTQLRDKTLNEAMNKLGGRRAGGASLSSLNNVLMQMRKNCNHPDLITAPFEGSLYFPPAEELVRDCGKMALMDRLMGKLRAEGHKILIFSQMTAMLDLLESYLDERGVQFCRIDGSVSWQDRQEAMKRFNTDPSVEVFLLSTRAGGLGINLTAADTVIIYDSDWNPHQDLQAMDRCHRIGQQKPVLVLRLATAHSVEGKMLRRAADKLMLEKLVIKKGAFLDVTADVSIFHKLRGINPAAEDKSTSMKADELVDLLKAEFSLNDKTQAGAVDEEMLNRLLDRGHLAQGRERPYPDSGTGYEVVQQLDGSGLLQGVE